MIIGIGEAIRVPGLVFTEAECGYAARQPNETRSLAGQFAAKEAFFKSVPPAVPYYWTDVEVVHDQRHAPSFRFSGELARCIDEKGWTVKLSITHCAEYAAAFVAIAERS
jgi:holo-[acyl-carrier protein] synthase